MFNQDGVGFVFPAYLGWFFVVAGVWSGLIPYVAATHGAGPSLIMAIASSDWMATVSYTTVMIYEYMSEVNIGAVAGRNSLLAMGMGRVSVVPAVPIHPIQIQCSCTRSE